MAVVASPQINLIIPIDGSGDSLDIEGIAPIQQEPFVELIRKTAVPNILKRFEGESTHLACYLIGRVTAESVPPKLYDALSIARWIQVKSRTVPPGDAAVGKLDEATTDPQTRARILNVHAFVMLKLNNFRLIAEYQEMQASFYTMNFWRLLLETDEKIRGNRIDKTLPQLSKALFLGRGCRQDLLTSIDYLKYGASRKDPESLFLLGELFQDGERGLTASLEIAEFLFSEAANRGHHKAQLFLARVLLRESSPGQEAVRDAMGHLNRASEGDFADAQYDLAVLLFWGFYGPPNRERAISLMEQAVAGGHEMASERLSEFQRIFQKGAGGESKE